MVDVFISYSHKDQEFAFKLHSWLVQLGIDAWIDKTKIAPGEKWSREIEEGLESCKVLLLIITSDSMASENVTDEWEYHLDQGKPLIPILLKPAKRRLRIHRLQYIDFFEQDEFVAFHQLRNALESFDVKIKPSPSEETDVDQIRQVWGYPVSEKFVELVNEQQQELNVLSRIFFEMPPPSTPPHVTGNETFSSDVMALVGQLRHTEQLHIKKVLSQRSGIVVLQVDVKLKNGQKFSNCLLQIKHAFDLEFYIRYIKAFATPMGRYMPPILDASPPDKTTKRIALLFKSFETQNTKSLVDFLDERLGDANALIQAVVRALQKWNEPVKSYQLSVPELFIYTFRHSNDPLVMERRLQDERSSISSRLREALGIDAKSTLLVFEHREYVQANPLSYLENHELWKEARSRILSWPCGHIHGNLALWNILEINRNDNKALGITDFDTYDPQNLVFWDFAFLELVVTMHLFRGVERKEAQSEIERFSEYLTSTVELNDLPNLGIVSVGITTILSPIRHAVSKICKQHSDYHLAFWIARLAVGLEIARKTKITQKERMIAFMFAADSLNRLLTDLKVSPEQGSSSTISWPKVG